jgi:hypothetical protein
MLSPPSCCGKVIDRLPIPILALSYLPRGSTHSVDLLPLGWPNSLSDSPPRFCDPMDPMQRLTLFELITIPIAHLISVFPRTEIIDAVFLSTVLIIDH